MGLLKLQLILIKCILKIWYLLTLKSVTIKICLSHTSYTQNFYVVDVLGSRDREISISGKVLLDGNDLQQYWANYIQPAGQVRPTASFYTACGSENRSIPSHLPRLVHT